MGSGLRTKTAGMRWGADSLCKNQDSCSCFRACRSLKPGCQNANGVRFQRTKIAEASRKGSEGIERQQSRDSLRFRNVKSLHRTHTRAWRAGVAELTVVVGRENRRPSHAMRQALPFLHRRLDL